MLNDKLESYQNKISELEVLLSSLKDGQSEVEIGFQKALETLSGIEEEEGTPQAPAQQEAASPAPESSADEAVEEESEEEEQTGAELDIF
jgi:hypothetical protein